MAPRNHKQWRTKPNVEYVSSLIYSDQDLYEQEIEQIFSKVWVPCFHESELPHAGNFRTGQIAGQNILAYNTGKEIVAYLNYNINEPSGTFAAPVVTSEPELHCEVKHGGMVWITLDLALPKV